MLANKTDAQASLERIQNFEEAFARIRSATGIEDIEELVITACSSTAATSRGQTLSLARICSIVFLTLTNVDDAACFRRPEPSVFVEDTTSNHHKFKQEISTSKSMGNSELKRFRLSVGVYGILKVRKSLEKPPVPTAAKRVPDQSAAHPLWPL